MLQGDITVTRTQVCIVDSNRLYREGLKQLLNSLDFIVCGEEGRLADLLEHLASADCPDFVLWNCDPMPNSQANFQADLALLASFRARFPGVRFIMLSDALARAEDMQSQVNFLSAVQAGVSAMLSTDISGEVLQRVLELVKLDQRMFPTHMVQALARNSLEPTKPPASAIRVDRAPDAVPAGDLEWDKTDAPGETNVRDENGSEPMSAVVGRAVLALREQNVIALSDRESQVLQCLVNGSSNKLIARDLAISEATVKVHVKGLMRKIRASNRTQAAIWAMNHYFAEPRTTTSANLSPSRPPFADGDRFAEWPVARAASASLVDRTAA